MKFMVVSANGHGADGNGYNGNGYGQLNRVVRVGL